VAQRLRTIKHADQILVLRDGRVVQRGRHEELYNEEGGYYREIYELQLRGQEEEEPVPAPSSPRVGFST